VSQLLPRQQVRLHLPLHLRPRHQQQQAPLKPNHLPDSPEFNWKKPSREEEIALGREITGNLLGAAPLVKDDKLQNYVNQVGRWVASQSERPDLPWRFGVIDSADINAFAMPGGYVLVTKGLYQKLTMKHNLLVCLAMKLHILLKNINLKYCKNSNCSTFRRKQIKRLTW
jgi:beta-barrel assembly-enhancing protease